MYLLNCRLIKSCKYLLSVPGRCNFEIFQTLFKTLRYENFDDSSVFWFCFSENVTTPRVSLETTKLKFPSKQIGNELIKKNFSRKYHGRKYDDGKWFLFYEYKFTVENKKTKKDIHQASRHLRMPGTNLKTIKFNNI